MARTKQAAVAYFRTSSATNCGSDKDSEARQRDAVEKLLGSREVETVGAGTAAECLQLLKEQTFDCMVLDLSLPDASGYSVLETLSAESRETGRSTSTRDPAEHT